MTKELIDFLKKEIGYQNRQSGAINRLRVKAEMDLKGLEKDHQRSEKRLKQLSALLEIVKTVEPSEGKENDG